MKNIKNTLIILSVCSFVLVAILSFTNKEETQTPPYTAQQIAKGKYLVEIMGCRDFHSPKMMTAQGPGIDFSKDLSGHPAAMPLGKIEKVALKDWVLFNMMNTVAVGPWGASYSANLTSDATGIGNWTEEQFIIALTEGKGICTARSLLPPMPWQNYTHMKKDEIVAIFAYLKSTKPVENMVPQPITPDKL